MILFRQKSFHSSIFEIPKRILRRNCAHIPKEFKRSKSKDFCIDFVSNNHSQQIENDDGNEFFDATPDIQDGVAIIKLKTNASEIQYADEALISSLNSNLDKLEANRDVRAVILISHSTKCFLAGASLSLLSSVSSADQAINISKKSQMFCQRIENFPKPVIAAVAGHCLGFGFELFLSCHDAVVLDSPKTRFSFPEIFLGFNPASGGIFRALEKIPLSVSVALILSGKTLSANDAVNFGLASVSIQPTGPGIRSSNEMSLLALRKHAIDLANKKANCSTPSKQKFTALIKEYISKPHILLDCIKSYIKSKNIRLSFRRFAEFHVFRRIILKNTENKIKSSLFLENFKSPLIVYECICKILSSTRPNSFEQESLTFSKLLNSENSKSLLKLHQISLSIIKASSTDETDFRFRRIGVLGSGTMGSGIAEVSAFDAGLDVCVRDISYSALARGQDVVHKSVYRRFFKSGLMSRYELDRSHAKMEWVLDCKKLHDCNVIIEAVNEDLILKQNVLREVENFIPSDSIYATNTSAISISSIAEAANNPSRVLGIHYCSPVTRTKIAEIIFHEDSLPKAIQMAKSLLRKQKRMFIVVKDSPGFVISRILTAMLSEVLHILAAGVHPTVIDEELMKFGFKKGGVAAIDLVGLDVASSVIKYLQHSIPSRFLPDEKTQILDSLLSQKYLGCKSGNGFYHYPRTDTEKSLEIWNPFNRFSLKTNSSTMQPSPMFRYISGDFKPDFTCVSRFDILMRIITRIVNEAAFIWQEGIVDNKDDIDLICVYGFGFPAFYGGPLKFAQSYGLDKVEKLLKYYRDHLQTTRFEPCSGFAA